MSNVYCSHIWAGEIEKFKETHTKFFLRKKYSTQKDSKKVILSFL